MRAANPGLRAHAFLNRTDPRGQDNDDAADVIHRSTSERHRQIAYGSNETDKRTPQHEAESN